MLNKIREALKENEMYYDAYQNGSGEIEIYVEDTENSGLDDVTECLGIYYSLVENGRNVTKTIICRFCTI